MSKYNKIKGETIQTGASADVDSERFYYDTTANEYRLKLDSPVASFSPKANSNPPATLGLFGDADGAFTGTYFYQYSRTLTPTFTYAPVVRTVQRISEWNGSSWSATTNQYGWGGLGSGAVSGGPTDARSVGGNNHQGWNNSGYYSPGNGAVTARNDHVEYNGSTWSLNPATFTSSGYQGNSKMTRNPDTSDMVMGDPTAAYSDWNGSTWSSSNIPSDPISGDRMSGGGADDMITATVSTSSPTSPSQSGLYMVEPIPVSSANIYNGTSWASTPAMNHGIANGNLMGDTAAAIAISNTITASAYPGSTDIPSLKGVEYDNNSVELWNGTTWTSQGKNPIFVPAAAGGQGSMPTNSYMYQSASVELTYNGGGTGSLNGLFWGGGTSTYGRDGAVFASANGYKYNFEA